ncbi:glycine zipper 2TM domain-containing protein [Undibacterium pigrum]|uniref:Outer membrane lipoprotein SlyB n=1 Tax=Undibacterium pigrum TaxID=401470 RepID=A0A318JDQ1_9BURK|nr:glycine zipper 2TM domain-containing protein [Undibacterium pigrum]PXX46637.1 outer membrane lipoprotein SlyB [Undibacterium pigrum]
MRKLTILTTIALVSVLAGCATQRYPAQAQNQYPSQYQTQPQYPAYGQNPQNYPQQYQNSYVDTAVIVGMREVNVGSGGSSGGGAVVGALIGGVLGHQVGKGTGRDLATVGGAIAGGVIGNEMERNSTPRNKLELTIRLHNGDQRAVLVEPNNYYRVGDRVRVTVQNGQLAIVP